MTEVTRRSTRSDAAKKSRLGFADAPQGTRTNRPTPTMMNLAMHEPEIVARRAETRRAAVADTPTVRASPDRRNASERVAVISRVRSEFRETPGLCVTVTQAARLFGLTEDICARVCDELVEDGMIQKSGRFYGAFRTEFVGAMFTDNRGDVH